MDIEIKQGDYGISYAIKRQLNAEGVNSKQVTTTVEGICRCGNDSKNNQ